MVYSSESHSVVTTIGFIALFVSINRQDYVTAFIDRQDEGAACQQIADSAHALQAAGADFIVITCNDVHRFVPWAGWHSAGATRPYFVINKPFDGKPNNAGNGQMSAFLAASRDQVRRAYAIALESGGICEGEPGLRPQYHPHYFGAYFRDPDGNKLCVACHHPE